MGQIGPNLEMLGQIGLIWSNWIKRVKVGQFLTVWVNVDIIGAKGYMLVKLCLI